MSASVLVVDDDPMIRELISDMLQSMGHRVELASEGEEALAKLGERTPDLMLLDLNLPNLDGLEVLKRAKQTHGSVAIVLISGSMTIGEAVEAMKLGACHCLTKPLSMAELRSCVERACGDGPRRKETRTEGPLDCPMVFAGPAMRQVSRLVRRIAESPARTVLLTGETGTGKEVAARHLHGLGKRRDANFVAVNCAAIPASLIESELFGHERGAFTDAKNVKRGLFEEAHGGTLFLDEIGELPLPLQAKLLRALQERTIRRVGASRDIDVDVCVVAATNVDLEQAVIDGKFREDLYYRLMVIPVAIPPLRERTEDILPLAEHFFAKFAAEFGRAVKNLSDPDREALLAHAWPGNVRELRNCIERAVLLDSVSLQSCIQMSVLPAARDDARPPAKRDGGAKRFVLSLDEPSLANAERTLIREVLTRMGGNKNQAASLLGIDRASLSRKLTGHGVACAEEAPRPAEA